MDFVSNLIPNKSAMLEHVHHIFDGAPGGHVELAWTDEFTKALSCAKQYALTDLDQLVEKAAEVNASGANVYIGAALRQLGAPLAARAKDGDYHGTMALYADLDDPGAVQAAAARVAGCKPTFIVTTGKEPHLRAQLWWRLDAPFGDPIKHRAYCAALAHELGGDPTVVNPSRVMRLAGSIAWPLKPGRVAEMTGILPIKDASKSTSLADLARTYNINQLVVAPQPVATINVTHTDVVVATPYRPTVPSPVRGAISGKLNVEACFAQIRSGNQWHNHVNMLMAHFVMRGFCDTEIFAMAPSITLPGYTVEQTVHEMQISVDGARRKWGVKNPINEFDSEAPVGVLRPRPRILTMEEIDALQPPTYCIDKLITEHGFTLIWGKTHSLKSFLALDMVLHMAYAIPYHGREVKPKRILYIAGEGIPGYKNRLRAWRKHYGKKFIAEYMQLERGINLVDQESIELLMEVVKDSGHTFDILVIDTVARSMVGVDENDAVSMGLFVAACDQVRQRLGCGVIAVHHSGKNSDNGPRGSSALSAAVDTEFYTERVDGTDIVTVTCKKQKDDHEAEPFRFKGYPVEVAGEGFKSESSLVLLPADAMPEQEDNHKMTKQQTREMLLEVDRAWHAGTPWSNQSQTKDKGRYLAHWVKRQWPNCSIAEAEDTIKKLMIAGFLDYDDFNKKTSKKGLRAKNIANY